MTAGFPGASAASRVRQPGTLIPSPRFFTTGLLPNPLGLSVLPSTLPGPGVWSGPAARGEGRKLGFRGVSCGPVRAWVGGGESESFGSTTRAWTPGAAQRRAGGEPADVPWEAGCLVVCSEGGGVPVCGFPKCFRCGASLSCVLTVSAHAERRKSGPRGLEPDQGNRPERWRALRGDSRHHEINPDGSVVVSRCAAPRSRRRGRSSRRTSWCRSTSARRG
jgi:hypothetical protein